MRAGAAQIKAGHRRARGQPPRPHGWRKALAVEDVSARQADLLFDVRRGENMRVDYRVVDIRAEAGKGSEREIAHFIATAVPVALCQSVRRVLRKNAHRVEAGRDDGAVVDALEVKFAPQVVGQLASARGGE